MISRHAALLLLAALSGVFGINYEVLFFRLITARFGDMLHVQAAVLSMFLLGVAIGAVAGDRLRRLWLLEMLVGITAMAVSLTLDAATQTAWLAGILQNPLATALICMLLVAAPATLIGCSVPLFSEYLAESSEARAGSSFRRIYATYALGAASSVLVTEYILVRALGTSATLALLAAGNIAIGISLYFFLPRHRTGRSGPMARPAAPRLAFNRGLASLFVLGCASTVFQMVFVRGAMEILGNGREIFALTLGLVLIGLPAGVLLARRFLIRDAIHLATIAIVLGFIALPQLQLLQSAWYVPASYGADFLNLLPVRVLWRLIILAPLGLVPFVCFGAVLPLALHDRPTSAREVGQAMFANGLGNACGYLLFIVSVNLLPELVQLLVVIAGAQFGLFLYEGGRAFTRTARNQYFVPAGLSVALLLIGFSTERYYVRQLASQASYRNDPSLSAPRTKHLHVARAGGTNAGIIHFRGDNNLEGKRLFYSGHMSIPAIENGRIRGSEVLSGVLPALFAPSLRRAAVIGIGTGITAGTTSRIFDRTDAIEINASVLALMPRFEDANFDLARNPAAHIVHNDARMHLAASGPIYDVVLNSVSVPSFESASKIYTTDFFRLAKRSLVPDGVYMTWVGMNDAALGAVIESLREVFRYCFATYLAPEYFMLTCADRRLRPRALSSVRVPFAITRVLAQYPRHEAEADTDTFINSLHLSDDFLATIPRGGPQNTDDRPVTEFVSGNPMIPWTLLRHWPRAHPHFLAADYVGGSRLDDEKVWERCTQYPTQDLWVACFTMQIGESLFVDRVLTQGWRVVAPPGYEQPLEELRFRWRILDRLQARAPLTPHLRRLRDSLVVALADAAPDDAEAQYAAASVATDLGLSSARRDRYRYQAFALDHRFRKFVK